MEDIYKQLLNFFRRKDFQSTPIDLVEYKNKKYHTFIVRIGDFNYRKLVFKYFLKDNTLIYAFYNDICSDGDFYGINSIKEVYSILDVVVGTIGCSEFEIWRNCKLI